MDERALTMSTGHVLPLRIYFMVFFSLLILTATTVAVAFVDMGPLNNLVAMGIAGLKATLVILFFMHVRYSTRLTSLVIASGLFALLIMVGLTLVDYATRGWLGVAGK
jgi:cytochrome c oxidase subunit 4